MRRRPKNQLMRSTYENANRSDTIVAARRTCWDRENRRTYFLSQKKIKRNTRHRNFLESTFFGSGCVWRNCVWIESSYLRKSRMYLYVTLYTSRGRRISVIASSCGHLIFHSSFRIKIRAQTDGFVFRFKATSRARVSAHTRNNYRYLFAAAINRHAVDLRINRDNGRSMCACVC